MVYIEELLIVMTDLLKIDRIGARNVPRLHEHKRLEDDVMHWPIAASPIQRYGFIHQ